jgi:hypothetical protein
VNETSSPPSITAKISPVSCCGRNRRWTVRAGIGAAGAWWLLLAEPVLTRTLVWGRPDGVPVLDAFDDAASVAIGDVAAGMFTSGACALAVVWALAAALLPVAVRNRSVALDVVGATTWAATTAAATASIAAWAGFPEPRGLVIGALGAGILAVWPPRGHGLLGSG